MPQTQFSTEVLPAPFGPISANSSPGCAANDTPSRTCSPPKASETPSIRNAGRLSIPAAAPAVLLDVAIAAAALAAAPEIELADILVTAQPLRRAVEDDAAVLDHVAVVGDLERDLSVLLDEQDGGARLFADRREAAHQLLDDERREALRELVDEQQLRVTGECRADREHLALAAREIAGLAPAHAGQRRKELVHGFRQAPAVGAGARHHRLEVLGDGEVLEHLAALRHQHDAERGDAVGTQVLDALPAVPNRARGDARVVEADESGDRPQQGGLTGAVGAEHRDDRALRHLDRHALHRGDHRSEEHTSELQSLRHL